MLSRRLPAVLLTIALVGGNAALCAEWAATPEARMSCCSDDADCPMHKSDRSASDSHRGMSQAQADSCCASSERNSSSQSTQTFTLTIPSGSISESVVLPATVSAAVAREWWRVPLSKSSIPKHVLLSVFLV
jgi:type IV pilus biogenesis protein CpaD/CtpE